MKLLVDELPYYNDECLFMDSICYTYGKGNKCPRNWDKYKVCSDNNPRECVLLKEFNKDIKGEEIGYLGEALE